MKERFKARNPRSMMLRFHAQTAGSTLTAQQPDNNVVRVTLQALAAVLGGCQSLHTNGRDEALSLPTQEAATLALRTQQVIAYESGVTDTADPLGGSYAIERLTDELEARAEATIRKIDDLGGVVAALSGGYIQKEIQDAAYQYQKEIETRRRVVVGLNELVVKEDRPLPLHRIDPQVEQRQAERVSSLKARRDAGTAGRALDAVRAAARGKDNLIPLVLEAVKASCTLGEVSDALRDVFGEHREEVVL
jgi:methylmalonyl-CoA mutase N-terminal domain/subunit